MARKLLVPLVVAALLIVPAARADERSVTVEVGGPDDCSSTQYQVPLPTRAVRITPSPAVGDTFLDGREVAARVTEIEGLKDGSKAVTWTVLADRCTTRGAWSAGLHTFTASYKRLPKRPNLDAVDALLASSAALERKFGNSYKHGYAHDEWCGRKVKQGIRRCKVRWLIGDLIYRGTTRVISFWDADLDPDAKVKYRIKRINAYCVATGGSGCTKTIRGKTGAPAYIFVRQAKTQAAP